MLVLYSLLFFCPPTPTTYLLNSEPFESKLRSTPFFIPKYLSVYFLKLRMFSSKATAQLSIEIIIGSPLSSLRWRCDMSPSFRECSLRFRHNKTCLAHPVLSQPLMDLDHFMFFEAVVKGVFVFCFVFPFSTLVYTALVIDLRGGFCAYCCSLLIACDHEFFN